MVQTPAGPAGMSRVAIIGVGAVGATTAYAMIQATAPDELLLVDIDTRKAEGELMDLQHSLPFSAHAEMRVATHDEVADADLIIITAGVAQKAGESRLNLVQRNLIVFQSFLPKLAKANPDALYLIITNPVDVMARVAMALTGLGPTQVFGAGTVLDTARFRSLLSRLCRIQARHVHAYVIGEHGDSEVPVWSRASIGPFQIAEYCELRGITLSPDDIEMINREVREAANEIILRKGTTQFAIALGTVRLVEALQRDLDSIFTVSRQCEGAYGLEGVCLSLPSVVNRQGAHTHFELELSASEHDALQRSAEVLDNVYQQLGLDT